MSDTDHTRTQASFSENQLSPIRQKILAIKKRALAKGASDVFLSAGNKPGCRVDGKTMFFDDEPVLSSRVLETFLKEVLSDNEMKRFYEGLEMDFALEEDMSRFRVNAFMQLGGISIAMRRIPKEVPNFESLQLPAQLKKIANMHHGLVLITGSMGSGKSTTLAAIVDLINKEHNKHIVTVEDPVEFIHTNDKSLIEQRELGMHTHGFGKALRSCLRQGADVILVGEMRDLETISLAITASETGALVLGTLHTNGASKAVNRMIDVFPAEQQNQVRAQLAESLKCVVWQALLPFKERDGRVAAFEILFHNYAVANLIREGKTYQLDSVIETSFTEGMIPMRKSLEWLVYQGLVDESEARRLTPDE